MATPWEMEKTAECTNAVNAYKSVSFIKNANKRENSPSDASSKNSFTKVDLQTCSSGSLFGVGSARLPSGPLLMLDRIVDIQSKGGQYDRGYAIAELDIDPSHWYFQHHFRGDPIMPGCFLVESLWQLAGFHMTWSGHKGRGRVLDSGRTRFNQLIKKEKKKVTISICIRKLINRDNPICIANGEMSTDNLIICRSDAIKVGIFK